MAREPRFPNIDWYCDNCGAYLNNQKNFNDHKYTWKCKECGYKNSISWDNINPGDNKATKFLLKVLGLLSFVGFETALMLAIAMFVFGADQKVYFLPFLIFGGIYVFAFIVTLIVQFVLRGRKFSIKNLCSVILEMIIEDILAPFWFVKEIISNFLSFLTHKLPFKRKYEWHSNKTIVAFAIIYTLIMVVEFIALSKIIGFGLNDWGVLFNNLINGVRQFIQRIQSSK